VGKFDPRQFGALKGRSTTHALIDITHMWHQALDDHNSARILFIDYSKAFDHVDHKIVLSKMKSFWHRSTTAEMDALVSFKQTTTR
jgi:hypothetical protein